MAKEKIKGWTQFQPAIDKAISWLHIVKEWSFLHAKKANAYYHASPWYSKTFLVVVSLIVCFCFYLLMVDFNFLWLFGKTPGLSAVRNPNQPVASVLYSADGKVLSKYFRENRTPVKYNEISPILIKALICTEDERFYSHFGIDLKGLFAAAKDMAHGDARGASTITQQLVKNLFKVRSQYSTGLLGKIPGLRMIIMKSKEWILAVKIEMFYSKSEILTMYFNTVDFGNNTYGIKTACKTYFGTTPALIRPEQAATLVGLLKATTTYNPRTNPRNSIKRRNVVLENMYTHHIITKAEFNSLKQIPIQLRYEVETNYGGEALYFRDAVAAYLEPWLKENGLDIYADGLKIYTTLDTRLQQYAEEAVNKQMRVIQRNFNNHWGTNAPWRDKTGTEIPNFIEDLAKRTDTYKKLVRQFPNRPDSVDYYMNKPHRLKVFDYDAGTRDTTISSMDSIRYMERFMHSSFVAMEPQSGEVKAWVGDISFNSWKYDKVTSKRQPGSTFKLFVYTEAMNQGLSPCDEREDKYIALDVMDHGEMVKWIPRNANGNFTGRMYSLKAAFAQSINTIAVQVAQEVGIHNIAVTAKKMGIKTPLEETPALSLGASDVSLLELVNAYSTVINEGMAHSPVLVTRIEDKDGHVIYQHKPDQVQAIPYESAFLMTEMLKGGLTERGGTTQALWSFDLFNYNTEFGGKTGTSSNHSDAWFVGVTPKLIAGAWVGGEHRSIHFRTGALGQGSRTALPIYGYFMEKVVKDPAFKKYQAKFPTKPKHEITRTYNCKQYVNVNDTTYYVPDDSLSIDDDIMQPGSISDDPVVE